MAGPDAITRTIIKNMVGGDIDDETVDLHWDAVAPQYGEARAQRAAVIVELLKVRYAAAAGRVDYQMNEEREALSQEARAIGGLLALWENELAALLGSARMGVRRRVPARRQEYPHD